MFNSFIYENLKFIHNLNRDTALCIYEPRNKLYVVKTVDASMTPFYEEISKIDSPFLTKILYISYNDDKIHVVREYISGETIAEKLENEKSLCNSDAVKYTIQICKGLASLHNKGLVHRDINPYNVIITNDGNAKIIDFGIVRSFKKETSSDTVILGTPGYAAPEQFGFFQSDNKTDIYAVGVLLNVMLTGKMPNVFMSSDSIGKIIKKCVEIDSANRYETVEELIYALDEKNVVKADRFVKKFPGLRSEKLSVVITASFGYFSAFILTIIHFSTLPCEWTKIFLGILSYLFCAVIPFFSFHNFLDIWNKLPFTAGASLRTQKIIYYFLGICSLFAGILIFSETQPPVQQ